MKGPRATQEPLQGLPKVYSPARQQFSKVKRVTRDALKASYPLQQSGVASVDHLRVPLLLPGEEGTP